MFSIGVDLGGTNIAIGLVNKKHEIVNKIILPTNPQRGYESVVNDIASGCKNILQAMSLSVSDIAFIGIGVPGKCSPDKKIVDNACNLPGFNNIDMQEQMNKYFPTQVFIENDANCAALGEYICGATKGSKISIMITLGTGIGGCVITDGKILNGYKYNGGEFGHQVIFYDGRECNCGRKGCWESYASATALIKDAYLAAINNPNSKLNDLGEINAKYVFDMAEANDLTAKKVIDNYIVYLAEGIANLVNIFGPEVIAIGGGISAQGEKLLVPLRKLVYSKIYFIDYQPKIVQALLGNDAGIVGAAALGFIN